MTIHWDFDFLRENVDLPIRHCLHYKSAETTSFSVTQPIFVYMAKRNISRNLFRKFKIQIFQVPNYYKVFY